MVDRPTTRLREALADVLDYAEYLADDILAALHEHRDDVLAALGMRVVKGWRITEHELGPHPLAESCEEAPACLPVYAFRPEEQP